MRSAAENPRAVIGDNAPPAPTPFDVSTNTVEALFEEARHWLDGAAITSQDEADAVGRLLATARDARSFVDGHRASEKKPHDDAGKEVQARYRPLLQRAELVATTCKTVLTPWLSAKEDEARRVAEEARLAAEQETQAAREAVRCASSLDEREAAEAQLRDARRAETEAHKLSKVKGQAQGGERAIGLRPTYVAEVADAHAYLKAIWAERHPDLISFLSTLAQKQTDAGRRELPGVVLHEIRKAA